MKLLYFKALLPVSVDIESIWKSIPHDCISLGGENSKYSVMYEGPIIEGLEVLGTILKQADDHEVSLKTFEKMEVDENVEEKETKEIG